MLPEPKPKAAALSLGMDVPIVQCPIETPKPYPTTEAAKDSWEFVCQFREECASICTDSSLQVVGIGNTKCGNRIEDKEITYNPA